MALKKGKNIPEDKSEEGLINEKVDMLQKEEAQEKRAEKLKYLPDKRTLTIIITAVLCFLIVIGGIFMVNKMRENEKYSNSSVPANSTIPTTSSSSSGSASSVTPVQSGLSSAESSSQAVSSVESSVISSVLSSASENSGTASVASSGYGIPGGALFD